MRGTTHKAIGTVVGASIVIFAVKSEQPMLALGAVTAPFGAMLPDIDHDRSKLGSQRKVVVNLINKAILGAFVALLGLAVMVGYIKGAAGLMVMKELLMAIPVCAACLVANSDKMREKFKFLHKHRGIMHTLLVPIFLFIGAFSFHIDWLESLCVGLALGYLSHLMADCLTVSGCPIAWPISEECVRFTKITTGTMWEYVGAVALSGLIILTGVYAGDGKMMYLGLWALPVALAVGQALAERIIGLIPKKKRQLLPIIGISALTGVLLYIVVKVQALRYIIIVTVVAFIWRAFKICIISKGA